MDLIQGVNWNSIRKKFFFFLLLDQDEFLRVVAQRLEIREMTIPVGHQDCIVIKMSRDLDSLEDLLHLDILILHLTIEFSIHTKRSKEGKSIILEKHPTGITSDSVVLYVWCRGSKPTRKWILLFELIGQDVFNVLNENSKTMDSKDYVTLTRRFVRTEHSSKHFWECEVAFSQWMFWWTTWKLRTDNS